MYFVFKKQLIFKNRPSAGSSPRQVLWPRLTKEPSCRHRLGPGEGRALPLTHSELKHLWGLAEAVGLLTRLQKH